METLKFKTNIKCGGCIAAVTPALNEFKEISDWQVNITDPDKILTIHAHNNLSVTALQAAMKAKGYEAVQI